MKKIKLENLNIVKYSMKKMKMKNVYFHTQRYST